MTAQNKREKRPRPVLTAQAITSAITFVLGQTVAFGLISEATNAKVISTVPIIVSAVFTVVALGTSIVAHLSSGKVTPSKDPRVEVVKPDGTKVLEPLVPLSLAVQAVPSQVGARSTSDDFADIRHPSGAHGARRSRATKVAPE